MANYKVGDIIRLSRNFIGMSQEELAFRAGLATETISRIESGKHKITAQTYKKIMNVLNYFPERNYAICSRRDMEIIEERKLLELAETKYEHDNQEYYINRIKEQIGDNVIDRQYVLRAEAMLKYGRDEKNSKMAIQELEQALRLTIKDWDFEEYKDKKYPYTYQELIILMNLSDVYSVAEQCEKALKMYDMVIKCLDSGYISGEDMEKFRLVVKRNMTITYEMMGKYELALRILEEVLEESIVLKYGTMISLALYDIAWNMAKLNEIYQHEHFSSGSIKEKLTQAYYVSSARNDKYIKNLARDFSVDLFNDDIKC